jgi:tetratricopeptide (TPR) repeat protein
MMDTTRYIDYLLSFNNFQDLESAVDDLHGPDAEEISQELARGIDLADAAGRSAKAAFMQFIIELVQSKRPGDQAYAESPADHSSIVTSAIVEAQQTAEKGNVMEAVRRLRTALEEVRSVSPDEITGIVAAIPIRLQLADLLRRLGLRRDALRVLEPVVSAFDIMRAGGASNLVLSCLELRALIYEDLRDFVSSTADRNLAVEIAEQWRRPMELLNARGLLAFSLQKRGDLRGAVRVFSAVLDDALKWGDPNAIAATRNNLAGALLEVGSPSAAADEFRKALQDRAHAGAKDDQGVALSWFGLGSALAQLGDADAAIAAYDRGLETGLESSMRRGAVAVYLQRMIDSNIAGERQIDLAAQFVSEAKRDRDWIMEASVRLALAQLHRKRGERNEAISALSELLGRARKRDQDIPPVFGAKLLLSELLGASLETCQDAFELLMQLYEDLTIRLFEIASVSVLSEEVGRHISVIEDLIHLLLRWRDELRLPDERTWDMLAFDLHEAAKSRSYLGQLGRARLAVSTNIPPKTLRSEEVLLERLIELERELLVGRSPQAREALSSVRGRLEELWAGFEQNDPDYVRLRRGTPATLSQVETLLAEENSEGTRVALLSYFVGKRGTVGFLLRSSPRSLEVIRSAVTISELQNVVVQLHRAFDGDATIFPPVGPISRDRPYRRSLDFFERLSPELLPKTASLDKLDLLCISPHGPLHLLPLHALPMEKNLSLGASLAISYVPSASVLHHIQSRRHARRNSYHIFIAGVAAEDDPHKEYFELDHTRLEGLRGFTQVVSGPKADKQRVVAGLSKSGLSHITCHGYFDRTDASASGLILSDGFERPPRNVGAASYFTRHRFILSVEEILKHRVDARLVTLRACASGMQALENAGDEFVGLPRAILYAGASTTLVALWNVDQRSSMDLLTAFYRHWDSGRNNAWRALREAQRELSSSSETQAYAHPYHWAPFVLIGDWR